MRFLMITFLISFVLAEDIKKSELKNVQVLSYTKKADIIKYMKNTVTKELGVKCKFCHNIRDYASDENEKKVAAREMMRMVMHINKNTMQPMGIHEVSCWVCHRGQEHPDHK